MSTGYAHADYAASLAEFGTPRHLPACDGWLLERAVPGSDHRDAMGPYPLFFCADWEHVGDDLAALADELVSVVVVSDAFCPLDRGALGRHFDSVAAYKDHYVADLSAPIEEIVSKSHRATVRRARKRVEVAMVDDPSSRVGEWIDLWEHLKARHGVAGLRAFSPAAFEVQLALPGTVMFEASVDGDLAGLDLWFVQGEIAYGHLVAFNDLGYANRASYATKWALMEYFSADPAVRFVDLGGAPGAAADDTDNGLARFKAGWSNTTRTAHLCSRVLQPGVYEELCRARSATRNRYFPAYRAGELTEDDHGES